MPTTVSPTVNRAAFPALDDAQDLLPHADPVGGGGDAADRHAVDGQQGADAAAYVTKRAERLDVGHCAGQDVPGREGVQILCLAHPLCLSPGKQVVGLAVFPGLHPFDHKAGGAAHPRQHCNVPHGAALSPIGTLAKGHYGL